MTLTLMLELNNEAFSDVQCGSEIARILRELASRIAGNGATEIADLSLRLLDVNGNTVGRCEVSQ